MNKKLRFGLVTLYIVSIGALLYLPSSQAAFDQFYVRLDRLSSGADLAGTVCVKTSTAGTEGKVAVTFPADFTISSSNTDWSVTTTSLPSGATAWPGITAPDVGEISGQTVTFESSDLTNSANLYCFNFVGDNSTTGAVGNDKTGSVVTKSAGDLDIDVGSYATAIITAGTDQVSITAAVPPTFNFSLGANAVALGPLEPNTVTSGAGVAVNVATIAANGYQIWVKGRSGAGMDDSEDPGYSYLYSPIHDANVSRVAGATINDTPESLASSTGYVLDANATTDSVGGDGVLSIDAEYDGADINSGGTISSGYQEVASSDGTTAGDVVTLVVRAKVSAMQEAGNDYTDTLTVVAAGKF
jgi:hypothetical protein